MTYGSPNTSLEREREPKRRRVRKGTQSCWECKRRKIRCTFAAPSNAICDGCRRRGSSCVSQEFPDEPSSAKLEDRLGRVEELLERLTRTANNNKGRSDSPANDVLPHEITDSNNLQKSGPRSTSGASEAIELLSEEKSRYHDVSSLLAAAWPSKQDLDAILDLPASVSELLECATFTLYSSSSGQDEPAPRNILQLPPRGSHPVLFARRLLLLGLYLQGAQRFPSQDTGSSPSANRFDTIMSRMVETSHNLVTSNDDLVGCVEGIECLMVESMFHNNAGNLRRAWLATRRAMLVAQMMGLHRGVESVALLKMMHSDTQDRIDPMRIWFRLVQMDRYLSLMLGLPLGYLENSFADAKALADCTPMERMQRLQCVAAGRIIHRNQAGIDDLVSALEIDTLLHEASSLMPPRWWLPKAGNDTGNSQETIRIMDVFTHNYLLVRLHLQYLLRFSAEGKYDYSKLTAVNASREVISWFVSFRGLSSTTAYCRGSDFLAFIATTTLCIAHLEARRQRRLLNLGRGDIGSNTIFNFLVHQRLADRGMMEQTVFIMKTMAQDGSDKIASRISSILQHLLEIEDDAALGGTYITDSAHGNSAGGEELECDGNISDGGNALRIYIPYFGTIKIERGGVSKSVLAVPETSEPDSTELARDSAASGHQDEDQAPQNPLLDAPAGYQVGGKSANPDWQAVPSHFSSAISESTMRKESAPGSPGIADTYTGQLFVPGLSASIDDWALQGVDMSFFDSLLQGANGEDYVEG
ncbi:Fc.00g093500.m01.CDS01 [Cosmosporella sp. VM-42]